MGYRLTREAFHIPRCDIKIGSNWLRSGENPESHGQRIAFGYRENPAKSDLIVITPEGLLGEESQWPEVGARLGRIEIGSVWGEWEEVWRDLASESERLRIAATTPDPIALIPASVMRAMTAGVFRPLARSPKVQQALKEWQAEAIKQQALEAEFACVWAGGLSESETKALAWEIRLSGYSQLPPDGQDSDWMYFGWSN